MRITERILWVWLLGVSLIFGFAEEPFRVMTYNIHHGQGMDGKVDPERIARLIKAQKADIVALQEVDRGTLRTGRRDLPAELAKLTGMNVHFEKNIDYQGGEYGNAVLTHFPILEAKNTQYRMVSEREQRGLLQVVLEIEGRRVLFLNTHLDFRNDDTQRALNAREIKTAREAHARLPVILCGDLNQPPGSRTHRRLSEFLTDTWRQAGKGKGHTFSSASPTQRIDYIWVSPGLGAVAAWVVETKMSDHLPVVGELRLE